MITFNLPETIELGPQHIAGIYVLLHLGYALATHFRWVQQVRSAAKAVNQEKGYSSTSHERHQICRKCMTNQLIPLILWGMEFKAVQSFAYVALWASSILLGGGLAKPFKMRLHKLVETSTRPTCKHGKLSL